MVLAGGRSRRMGAEVPVDKLDLDLAGRTSLDRVVGAARAAGARPVVRVGRARRGGDGPGRPAAGAAVVDVDEDPPGSGPAASVAAGVAVLGTDVVLLLAGDLPLLSGAVLRSLVDRLRGAAPTAAGVVAVDAGGREQWLLSAWRTQPLRRAVEAAGALAGRPLTALLAPLRPDRVALAPGPLALPAWFDCDSPDDLAQARRALDHGPGDAATGRPPAR